MALRERFMRRAIQLARRGRGRVEPNPMVGAVVVRGDRPVGEGWHQHFGGPHAEINALTQAGEAARGADLYVTLEPCCVYGKTPPCTDAIIAADVARVITGIPDPTQGDAVDVLRQRGIDVVQGCLQSECEKLAAPFVKLHLRHRPYVTAKWAMTSDGKVATHTRDARWISSEASRRVAHRLRHSSDAVMVGIATVLIDDPLLTCRLPGGRSPRRVVLDSRARLPLTSRLVRTAAEAPLWVFCKGADASRTAALRSAGCKVFDIGRRHEQSTMDAALAILAEARLTHVLIEGGTRVLTSAFEEQAVDEVRVFVAPKLIGGEDAPSPLGGRGVAKMAEAIELVDTHWQAVGGDALLEARVRYPQPRSES